MLLTFSLVGLQYVSGPAFAISDLGDARGGFEVLIGG